jgi:hypothetical protein
MLRFAGAGDVEPLRLLVRHDDGEREVAYDAGAEEALGAGFTVISMKDAGARCSASDRARMGARLPPRLVAAGLVRLGAIADLVSKPVMTGFLFGGEHRRGEAARPCARSRSGAPARHRGLRPRREHGARRSDHILASLDEATG